MAFNHHHHHHRNDHRNHHPTTTATTCCFTCQTDYCQQPPPPPPPPPSSLSSDPFLVATIVSQILHNQNLQNPQNFYSQPFKPTTLNPSPFDFSNPNQNQKYPNRGFDQFQQLLQRIDVLEESFHRLSSTSCSSFSLRDVAARTIQTHFRVYLVRRSRTLRHLKDLASIKSSVGSLKSSLSRQGFVAFDSLSRKAMDLLLKLDSIQGDDKMIRDSKRSVTREIVQFLELVDGVCVKRHQTLITQTMKNLRLVKNDSRNAEKCRNVGNNEKKLIANLRERVERIGRMSRVLEDQEEDAKIEGLTQDDDEDDMISIHQLKNEDSVGKHALHSNARKNVLFVDDGNMIRVYDVDEDTRNAFGEARDIEDCNSGRQDEEEPHGYNERSTNHIIDETSSKDHHDVEGDFTFSAPEPVKMESRAGFMTRKPGVKIG